MNDFNKNGFLGTEAELISKQIYQEFEALFQYCEELNRFTIAISSKMNVHNNVAREDVKREVILGGLYLKILNASQSVIILTKYGLDIEANIIARTALESLFWLAAIVKRKNVYKKFIDTYEKSKFELIERIKTYPDSFHPDVVKKAKEYETNCVEGKNSYKIETVAKIAKLQIAYDNAYSILCLSAHPDLKNIETRYFDIKDGEIVSFNTLPSTRDIEMILSTNCYIILSMLENLNEFFKLDITSEIEGLHQKYKKLFHV